MLLGGAGLDHKASGSFSSASFFGWSMLRALQITGQLEGGLTTPT